MKKLGWILIICLLFLLLPVSVSAQTNLLTPGNNQIIFTNLQYYTIDFSWSDYDLWLSGYSIEVSTSPELTPNPNLPGYFNNSPIFVFGIKNTYPATHYQAALPLGTYYWHVQTWYRYQDGRAGNYSVWSPIYSFTIQNPPPLPSAPVKVKAQSIISLKTIPKKIKKGKTAILKGRLFKRGSQANIAGVPVIIQRRSLGYWTATRVLKTKTDGSFAVRLKPSKTAVFRAHFQENNNYLSSSSNSVKIAVIQPKKKPKKKR